MSGSVGFMYRSRPFESLSPLSPLICDVFDIFNRYGYHYPHEYPYPHETGATEESAFQLNCRFALRRRVDLQAMQPRLKVQVLVVTLTEQPFSCRASKEQVLGYLATHTD
jgi:hypothetical protein